jgi:predicted RNA binding protein YcfA (HicA-like mRNA interferase family)
VRRRDLERRLAVLGWFLLRHGGNHDVWTDGERLEYVPRHAEVNELLARRILAKAASKEGSE